MSDLAATNCNTSCNGCSNWGFGGNSCLWIIILLFFCNNGSSWNRDDGCGCGCGCDSIIWILILLSCCGNNSGNFGLGCGCGC